MKLLNFAIASMVDANTGNAVNRDFGAQFLSNHSSYRQFGGELHAASFVNVPDKIKSTFNLLIKNYKARAREIRDTEKILQMSSHMLKDIGLSFEDLQDLESRQITLKALGTLRNQYCYEAASNDRLNQTSNRVWSKPINIDSANQAQYQITKCA
jgi:uncharacterized protein YjiS (DUF1127 family)